MAEGRPDPLQNEGQQRWPVLCLSQGSHKQLLGAVIERRPLDRGGHSFKVKVRRIKKLVQRKGWSLNRFNSFGDGFVDHFGGSLNGGCGFGSSLFSGGCSSCGSFFGSGGLGGSGFFRSSSFSGRSLGSSFSGGGGLSGSDFFGGRSFGSCSFGSSGGLGLKASRLFSGCSL